MNYNVMCPKKEGASVANQSSVLNVNYRNEITKLCVNKFCPNNVKDYLCSFLCFSSLTLQGRETYLGKSIELEEIK